MVNVFSIVHLVLGCLLSKYSNKNLVAFQKQLECHQHILNKI